MADSNGPLADTRATEELERRIYLYYRAICILRRFDDGRTEKWRSHVSLVRQVKWFALRPRHECLTLVNRHQVLKLSTTIGIANPISSAERQSQKPTRAMITTSTIAA
jgi:hypothetical protein